MLASDPMPRNTYEYLFLFDNTKIAGDVQAAVAQLHATFEKHKAEIVASRPWDDRKLAYPIRHQKKGLYYLIYVKVDTQEMSEIERDFKLNEALLRFMAIYIEPKWQEEMLAVAHDPHALALQTARNEDALDPADANYDLPRRPRSDEDKD